MKFIKPLLFFTCLSLFLVACSSEKRQSELIEKKLREKVNAVNIVVEKNGQEYMGCLNTGIVSKYQKGGKVYVYMEEACQEVV